MVASVTGTGLFTQTSAGDQWEPFGRSGDTINNRMSQLLVDPQQPNTIWEAGNFEFAPVTPWRTFDRSLTAPWTPLRSCTVPGW